MSVTPNAEYKNICQVVQALIEQERQLKLDSEFRANYFRRRNAAILADGKQMAIYQHQRKIFLQKQNRYRAGFNNSRKYSYNSHRLVSFLL